KLQRVNRAGSGDRPTFPPRGLAQIGQAMGGSRMSRRRALFFVLPVGLLLAAAVVVWLARPKKVRVVIEVTGTPGIAGEGAGEVDGTPQQLTGSVPAEFVLEGTRVTFSLASREDSGEIRVKSAIGGRALGSAGSGNPPTKGVRGWVKSRWGWSEPTHW